MIKTMIKTASALSLFVLLLTGCGGGGGGGGGSSSLDSFVKWSSIDPPTTVKVNGISQDAAYTAPGPSYVVTDITDNGVSSTSSATIKYNEDGAIVFVTISTPFTSVTWDEVKGDIIDSSAEAVTMLDFSGSSIGILANAAHPSVGWEYQTFGVWETGRGTGSGTVGAITVGAPTTGAAIPTVAIATFEGVSSGTYLDATGTNDYITVSTLTANVNFEDREIFLSTSETVKIDVETAISSPADNLNMAGVLSYSAGTNSFTGNVLAGGLSGTSTGQFYGPGAEELGGVFKLKGTDLESYSGGYGAKR